MRFKTARGLRGILSRNGLRQKDMADALRQPADVISRWVSGDRRPDVANTLRILEFLQKYEPSLQAGDLFKGSAR